MGLPEVIPLFPLPNVVLFPRMPLPLHVFEPRYRAMTRDALAGARLIGMVLLRRPPGSDFGGTPPIFPEGTVGEIVHHEELPDGRYNLVLRGVREFRIAREFQRHSYREAAVAWRRRTEGPLPPGLRDALWQRLEAFVQVRGHDPVVRERFDGSDDETFVNFLAQHLDMLPLERQALLEAPGLVERGCRLHDVLEFRTEELKAARAGGPARTH